jgi:hydrogenase maturation protein HypF
VLRVSRGRARPLRRSRGYVPAPVFLHRQVPPILAVGGELKNTVCLTKGANAFLSQHIGDLENVESFRFFEEVIAHLKRILEIQPRVIAHDLHPDYFSTRWARAQAGLPLIGVQHHHAHVAACMAENHLEGRVIGFALDGTGYGTDGHIWGGEVVLADYHSFDRAAHFNYVPMPGGAAAIREPWRMAVSYLFHHFGRGFLRFPLPLLRRHAEREIEALLHMVESRINSPLTSSCGRLFDAVAALLGVREQVNYEGQAAIELEMAMEGPADSSAYPLALREKSVTWEIGTWPLFEAILRDLRFGLSPAVISRRFHNGLVQCFVQIALLLRERSALNRVCLSGGTFQNTYLSELLETQLLAEGFEVFTHSEVPANDGGLSLGQALVAAYNSD